MEKQYLDPEGIYKQPTLQALNLKCPNCGHLIPTSSINIGQGLAQCDECATLFKLEDADSYLKRQKEEVFMPKGIEMLKLSSELEIEVSWQRSLGAFLTFFTLFWNGILFFIGSMAILSGNYEMLLFMSLHLFVGICLIYYTLTNIFNTTHIMVNEYRLLIEHKPLKLPFYPNRDIPVSDIEQIFIEQYVSSKTNDRPNYSFAVSAILKNKDRKQLVKGLTHPEQALYIEQEIETFLKIPDKKVRGEWTGDILEF